MAYDSRPGPRLPHKEMSWMSRQARPEPFPYEQGIRFRRYGTGRLVTMDPSALLANHGRPLNLRRPDLQDLHPGCRS